MFLSMIELLTAVIVKSAVSKSFIYDTCIQYDKSSLDSRLNNTIKFNFKVSRRFVKRIDEFYIVICCTVDWFRTYSLKAAKTQIRRTNVRNEEHIGSEGKYTYYKTIWKYWFVVDHSNWDFVGSPRRKFCTKIFHYVHISWCRI